MSMPQESSGEEEKSAPNEKQLPDVLPPELDSSLRSAGLDPHDPKINRAVELTMTMLVASGTLPMPPPEILDEYEKRFPGIVRQFTSWTDEQRRHRIDLENKRSEREQNRLDRSQTFTFIVAITGLLASAAVGVFGSAIVASVLAIVSIGGPTAAIWLARGNPTERDDD